MQAVISLQPIDTVPAIQSGYRLLQSISLATASAPTPGRSSSKGVSSFLEKPSKFARTEGEAKMHEAAHDLFEDHA